MTWYTDIGDDGEFDRWCDRVYEDIVRILHGTLPDNCFSVEQTDRLWQLYIQQYDVLSAAEDIMGEG